MKLGDKVKCSGYEKRLRIKPVFLDEKSKRDWEAENTDGYEIENFEFLDNCPCQDLYETKEVNFEGIIIGKKMMKTIIYFDDAMQNYHDYCDAVGGSPNAVLWNYKNNVKVTKEHEVSLYRVAFRLNQTRLVRAENLSLVEVDRD